MTRRKGDSGYARAQALRHRYIYDDIAKLAGVAETFDAARNRDYRKRAIDLTPGLADRKREYDRAYHHAHAEANARRQREKYRAHRLAFLIYEQLKHLANPGRRHAYYIKAYACHDRKTRIKERVKSYYRRNVEAAVRRAKAFNDRELATVGDNYVKGILIREMPFALRKAIPRELIDARRERILTLRQIRSTQRAIAQKESEATK